MNENYLVLCCNIKEAHIPDNRNMRELVKVSVIQPVILSAPIVNSKNMLNIILRILLGSLLDRGLACFSEHTSSESIQFSPLKEQIKYLLLRFYDSCVENSQTLTCSLWSA